MQPVILTTLVEQILHKSPRLTTMYKMGHIACNLKIKLKSKKLQRDLLLLLQGNWQLAFRLHAEQLPAASHVI